MVTSAQCGQAPHAASESSPYAATPGTAWERAYPGDAEQLCHLRAALRQLLRNRPVAGDVILLMSEFGANVTAATHPAHDRPEKEERP